MVGAPLCWGLAHRMDCKKMPGAFRHFCLIACYCVALFPKIRAPCPFQSVSPPILMAMLPAIPPDGPQLWKQVFLCGTELEQLSQVYGIRWDFSHLDEAIQEGFLAPGKSSRQKVFHFGQTEPQMIPDGNRTTVVPIPVIISVETDVDLPSSESNNDT